jgi:MYXO-CTERM domain-containing protein
MIAILDTSPRLVTQNSEDADLDPLTYTFELDTVDSFDSPDFVTSGPLDEVPGFTQWQLTDPLRENQIYHWRVKSNDGTIDSEQRQTAFYVVRDPALGPPDAGPADAGFLGDGGRIPGLDGGPGSGGGGCSAGVSSERSSRGPAWLALLALLGLGLAVRRRRG